MGSQPTPAARGLVYPAELLQTPRQQAMSHYESSKNEESDLISTVYGNVWSSSALNKETLGFAHQPVMGVGSES